MLSWHQEHANHANQGLMDVETRSSEHIKWQIELGDAVHASPVIGADGVIYIGTVKGDLIAVDPKGHIKWRHAVTKEGNPGYPGVITGSPAVGQDGNIYIITTIDAVLQNRRDELSKMIRLRRSSLHSFTPAGNHRWSYRFPANANDHGVGGYTTSSPKIWGEQNIFIFMPAIYLSEKMYKIEMLVINQSGNLVNQTTVANYFESSIDPNMIHSLSAAWNFIEDIEENAGYPEPSLAIVDFAHHKTQPLIVIDDNYKLLSAYRWNFPVLALLWSNFSDNPRQHTSASVYPAHLLLLGCNNGMISSYDANHGTQQFSYQADYPVTNPPLFYKKRIYFTAGNEVTMLNSDFKIANRYELPTTIVNSVALSANHIYVSARDGFYTMTLNLEVLNKNQRIKAGLSSPIISPDATIYVVDKMGTLFAI